jgi:hypothetical protein
MGSYFVKKVFDVARCTMPIEGGAVSPLLDEGYGAGIITSLI